MEVCGVGSRQVCKMWMENKEMAACVLASSWLLVEALYDDDPSLSFCSLWIFTTYMLVFCTLQLFSPLLLYFKALFFSRMYFKAL